MKYENIPAGYHVLEYGVVIEQDDLFMDKTCSSTNASNWHKCISSIGQVYGYKGAGLELPGSSYYIIRADSETIDIDSLAKKLRAKFKSLGYTNIVITADKTETFEF
jgi:hypothetical protein